MEIYVLTLKVCKKSGIGKKSIEQDLLLISFLSSTANWLGTWEFQLLELN